MSSTRRQYPKWDGELSPVSRISEGWAVEDFIDFIIERLYLVHGKYVVAVHIAGWPSQGQGAYAYHCCDRRQGNRCGEHTTVPTLRTRYMPL